MRNKLKQFLADRGLSIYRFRADTGVAHRTAYDLVNNPDIIPGAKVVAQICETYKIQPNEIMEWVEGVLEEGGRDR